MTDGRPRVPGHRRMLMFAALAIASVAAACGGDFPQSSLLPQSDVAREIDSLFRGIFWWAMVVFVVVEGALIVAIIRFRERPGAPKPRPVHGHTLLEIGWTLAPAIILIFIGVPTMITLWRIDRPPERSEVRVEVVGHQWWWEFNYPDLGITTANELHVPVGKTVDLRLRSADVIHSFWFPRVAGKRDLVPGRVNQLWFTPDSVGVYPGQCAEFCGTSHALMAMRLHVEAEEDFERWVEQQLREAVEVEEAGDDPLVSAGRDLFFGAGGCISCHQIRGTVAAGILGPDLTHVGGRGTIAAGVLENTLDNLASWIKDPHDVKPGNLMLDMGLDDEQTRQIAAYLLSLE
ncbi:MAG: cytochrome c oxidase subunit II [Gemmatimonadota bacterium]